MHFDLVYFSRLYAADEPEPIHFKDNRPPAFVLEVPLRNLLTSMCDFVPCKAPFTACSIELHMVYFRPIRHKTITDSDLDYVNFRFQF